MSRSAPPATGRCFRRRWAGLRWFRRGNGGDGDGRDADRFFGGAWFERGTGGDDPGEIRFVAAILDSMTVFLIAPFTATPVAGTVLGPTITYPLAESLGSVSIFDYWDPAAAVQRILEGAAMD